MSTKRKRKAMLASDSEDEDFNSIKESTKPAKKRKKAEHKVLASDSDEEAIPSISKTPKSSDRKKKSPKLPKQKNTLDKYFTFISKTSASTSTTSQNSVSKVKTEPEKTALKTKNETRANMREVSADEFFIGMIAGNSKLSNNNKSQDTKDKCVSNSASIAKDDNVDSDSSSIRITQVSCSPNRSDPKKGSKVSTKSKLHKNATEMVYKSKDSAEKKTPATPKTPTNSHLENEKKTPLSKSGKNAASYIAYLNRDGPKHLGERDLPPIKPNTLHGLTIVLTGVLDYFDKGEVDSFISSCGGKCTKAISKKTSLLVMGREPGASKIEKAKQFGTKRLSELDFYQFIEDKVGPVITATSSVPASDASSESPVKSDLGSSHSPVIVIEKEPTSSATLHNNVNVSPLKELGAQPIVKAKQSGLTNIMWVDKYKPTTMKQIVGQQGSNSCASKLLSWLDNWHRHMQNGSKKSTSGITKWNDDGTSFKAALLSGPPGIGKTTTATVVCNHLEFSFVELNASDTRNKKSLSEVISGAVQTHSVIDFVNGCHSSGQKHCIIMDEVDGMSGNQDRGGVQELIQVVKNTKIPIICICNDRNDQKMRSFANYTFDLRVPKPRPEQIKAAVLSIAAKEGIQLPGAAVSDIIAASNNDLRQSINNIEMWCVSNKNPLATDIKRSAQDAHKDLKFGPFDLVRKVFSPSDTKGLSMNQKADFFFQDYNFEPLFVQENYLNVDPVAISSLNKKEMTIKLMNLVSKTADSIANGDLVSKIIRTNNNFSLLPVQAIYSSVLPGEYMRGHFTSQIAFPSWLGKNSTTGKFYRQASALRTHLRLSTSGCSQQDLTLDYLKALQSGLTRPLMQKGVDGVAEVMDMLTVYNLLKEDMDSVNDMCLWPNTSNPMEHVDSKVKAALTRTYNKSGHLTPYSIAQTGLSKKGRKGGRAEDTVDNDMLETEGEDLTVKESDEEEDDDDNAVNDAMIKSKNSNKQKGGKQKTTGGTNKRKKDDNDVRPPSSSGAKKIKTKKTK